MNRNRRGAARSCAITVWGIGDLSYYLEALEKLQGLQPSISKLGRFTDYYKPNGVKLEGLKCVMDYAGGS